MYLEKITVEIERWFNSSSTDNTGCPIQFPWSQVKCQSYLIQKDIFLISKLYIYKSRKNKFLSSTCLLKEISGIKNTEKNVASPNEKKSIEYKRKQGKIEKKLP